MIRKILNVLVVLLIIAGISFTFINLYNSSKLEGNSFNNSSSKSNKGFEKNKNSKKKIESNSSDDNTNSTSDDKKDDSDSTVNEADSTVSDKKSSNDSNKAQEIEVASTSSFKSNTLTIMGITFILVGGAVFGLKNKKI